MSIDTASLLSIMEERLDLHQKGKLNPDQPVLSVMKSLVENLNTMGATETVNVIVEDEKYLKVKYVRALTNDIIAEYEVLNTADKSLEKWMLAFPESYQNVTLKNLGIITLILVLLGVSIVALTLFF
mgnify:CR=1 FL=1